MFKKVISLSFSFTFLFSQVVDHQAETNIYSNTPLNLEVYTDYKSSDITLFNIFYRLHNDAIYVKDKLNPLSDSYYNFIIPSNFIDGKYIEYYFLLELVDGSFISYPNDNPHNNPISVRIDPLIEEDVQEKSYLDADYMIISPLPEEQVLKGDIVISLSYYRMEDIDVENVKVFIDDIDMSIAAEIRNNNIAIVPQLSRGRHTIKVILSSLDGIDYNPIIWSFYVVSAIEEKRSFSGKLWNDYNNNQVDSLSSTTNTTNLNVDFRNDWIKLKAKFKKSSLEDKLYQAKDRYGVTINLNDSYKINLGDFYPDINDFTMSGNRVRGVGINYKSKLFEVDFINGELARSVQGTTTNGVIVSDYSNEFICDEYGDDPHTEDIEETAEDLIYCISGHTEEYVNVSRSGYTFERDLLGLRVGYNKDDRINFGFNFLKVSDDKKSISKTMQGAIVTLPYDLDLFADFNSDIFIDLNQDNEYTLGEPLVLDNDDNGLYDDFEMLEITDVYDTSLLYSTPERILINSSIIIENCTSEFPSFTECEDGEIYSTIQYVWVMKVEYDNLNDVLLTSGNYEDLDKINFLDNQWAGNKPEENLVLATDFLLTSKKNKFRFKSSLAASLQNNNTWDDPISESELDAYDGFQDCYIGRTYINKDEIDDCDVTWEDCEFVIGNTEDAFCNNITPIVKISGTSINDFDIDDFLDYFTFTVDNIPFSEVIAKYIEGESVKLYDVFNSSNVAYDMDFSLKVLKQHINFGIKQIGSSFNSLGNPYMQKDVREQYFNNNIRLLENRLFLLFKWNQRLNGILSEEPSTSNKYNVNVNYYPGIGLPSFAITVGQDKRNSGGFDEGYTYEWNPDGDGSCSNPQYLDQSECETIYGEYDNRIKTTTNNLNLSLSQTFDFTNKYNLSFSYFNSVKDDELFHELAYDDDGNINDSYISPRSKSNNLGVNLHTDYNYHWESNLQISRSYFDYAQLQNSEYYQSQSINSLSSGFSYNTDNLLTKIGSKLDYSSGSGTSSFSQVGLRLFANLKFKNDINLNLNYSYRYKKIKNEDNYNNSIFKINLTYQF